MICKTCNSDISRIRIVRGHEVCAVCGDFSEAGGIRTDGVLSRQRKAAEAVKYEGDTLNPWQYNNSAKKFEPNPEFLKRHAVNAQNFFKPEDLGAYPQLAQRIREGFIDKTEVQSVGDTNQAVEKAVQEAT